MKQSSGHKMTWNKGKGQDGRTYEHRDVAAKKIGRALKPNEIVHHKNGRPGDNRPGNLEVMTRGEHNKKDPTHHNGGRKKGS